MVSIGCDLKERERIALVSPVRTAIGRFGGSLKDVSPLDLGAHVARETLRRSGVDPGMVDRVVAGQNMQVTPRGNPARQVLLRAGIPAHADDYAVNMNCSSSLRAMTALAQDLLLQDVSLGIAVGMENMSRSPYLLEGARFGYRLGNGVLVDFLADYILGDAGPMAELVAGRYGISREEQDAYALESHRRAVAAIDACVFKEQIVPFPLGLQGREDAMFEVDEHPRRDTTLEKLARLKPAFRPDGTVTAGNSSGINDGAAAVLMVRESRARELGLRPAGYLRAWAAAGVEPEVFGIGPVPAVRKLLDKTGISLQDIGLIELNEAFASSTIAVMRDLKLSSDRVNVNGGAIALGHPVGATGLVLVTKLLHEMARRGVQFGVVTMCVGSGQGMAVLFELE
jgi:acetyl-CoA C-acetyltransferase